MRETRRATLAAALILLSYAALENLWAEYQDSPDPTYIEVAAIELTLAPVAIAGARRAREQERWSAGY